MWNTPSENRLSKIPNLYETDEVPLLDKVIHLHFFIGSSDWYIAEYDGDDTFFGYAVLNGNTRCSEFGYISFRELKDIKLSFMEVDCERAKYWNRKMIRDIQCLRFLKEQA